MLTRRAMIVASGAAFVGGAAALSRVGEVLAATPGNPVEDKGQGSGDQVHALPPGAPDRDYMPVITPNGATLPFKVVDGVKVYHLIAEEVEHEFAPGLTAICWGY